MARFLKHFSNRWYFLFILNVWIFFSLPFFRQDLLGNLNQLRNIIIEEFFENPFNSYHIPDTGASNSRISGIVLLAKYQSNAGYLTCSESSTDVLFTSSVADSLKQDNVLPYKKSALHKSWYLCRFYHHHLQQQTQIKRHVDCIP